jgi:hypothetical protein
VTSALFGLRRVADHIGGLRVVAYRFTEAVRLSRRREEAQYPYLCTPSSLTAATSGKSDL